MAAAEPVVTVGGRVVIRALLIPFSVLAGYFVAWGIVFCMDAIVRAFFGTAEGLVGWIPYAGRVLTSPLRAIEHKLTSFLGGLEAHFEHQMATRWYQLGQLFTRWAAETEAGAVTAWHIAHRVAWVYGQLATGKFGARLQRWVEQEIAKLGGKTVTIIRPVQARVVRVTKYVAARTSAVAGELEHVIEWDLPRLRARTKALEDRVGKLARSLRKEVPVLAGLSFVAAVAAVLARLGLSWARCNNVGKVGKSVCGMNPSLLESLLADSLLVVGSLSLVEFAEEMVGVTDLAVRPITDFWRAS